MKNRYDDYYYYEGESADLAAEMDADRRAERESEMGPEDNDSWIEPAEGPI